MKIEETRKPPSRILTATGGFLAGYSHSLNPYAGCSYGCSYCYVRKLPVAMFRGLEWGEWVHVKEGASERLRKELISAKKKGPVTIFMSSSTDPYQPVEHRERLTRSLLETMADNPPDFLFVQTRSPLVVRDIDLFAQFGDNIRISVTIETDLDEMRKLFAPAAPPIAARFAALRKLSAAGLQTQAAVAPVLPSSERFASKLAEVTERVCLDDYFQGDGSFGKRTEQLGIRAIYDRHGLSEWYSPKATAKVLERLQAVFRDDQILLNQEGFAPS